MSSFRVSCYSCLFVSVALLYSDAQAYEIETHKKLSEEAAKQSILENFLPLVGLTSMNDPLVDIDKKLNILDWIKLGANDEDDTLSANFARYRNHFYDPQHNGVGYSFHGLTGEPSPDWALEDSKTFATQSYSFSDARQSFYDALTLPNRDNREMWMARTFYTLGHVIHHIQDMAQPQHTRNDSHGGGLLGPFSRYERYTDLDRVRGNLPFSDTNYNQNNPVIFDKARKFWDGGDGRGIAEFSSLNFVSAGTNFGNPQYPSPSFADAVAQPDEPAAPLLQAAGISVPPQCSPCTMKFYKTHVADNYRPSASGDNVRASTSSIFDQDLQAKNAPPTFSLNRFNFEAAHTFLIPRAVAYSAGLINYFFRGRLDAIDANYTATGVQLRVKNAIDTTQNPQLSGESLTAGGKLIVAYDYKVPDATAPSGLRTEVGASNVIDLTETLLPGKVSQTSYSFALPPLPDNATDERYRLVYRGKLGNEDDAVVAGAIQPLGGFLVYPSYTPADGIPPPRPIYKQGRRWKLDATPGLVAGNVDWKGQYANGVPTKVLSWQGPMTRYFPNLGLLDFGTQIYQQGELWSVAPKAVLGAAIAKDTSGLEWLVAIGADGANDYVYRRRNTKSNSDAMFNAATAPEGWQLIATFVPQNGTSAPDRPWSFNGTGTEAQTMRGNSTGLTRLKIVVSGGSAQISDLGNYAGLSWDTTASNTESGPLPPGYPCSASGTFVSDATLTLARSGQYVVAVDYKNLTETLVKIIGSGQQVQSFHVTTEWGPSDCRGQAVVEFSTTSNIADLLEFDQLSIPLLSADGTSTGSYVLDYTGWLISGSGSMTISGGIFNTSYIDARNNLYAGSQMVWDRDTQQTISDGQYCLSSPRSNEKSRDVVFYGSQITAAEAPNPPWNYCRPQVDSSGDAIGIENRILPGLFPEEPRPASLSFSGRWGSWAVDSGGSLFVSQQTLDSNNPFHYLTDGDITAIIPSAPSGALYSATVIK
jgi:hypothetical protein